jgi:hypothetical protein
MHHEHCPAHGYGCENAVCKCTDPDTYIGAEWCAEDVRHLDELILGEKCRSTGLLALPGIEWVRNMIAARVGLPLRPLGWDLRDEKSEAA